MSRVRNRGANGRRNVKMLTVSYAAANSSVFRRALKVVMVADHFATGDGEFQTIIFVP